MTFRTWQKPFVLNDNGDLVSQCLDISHEYFGSQNQADNLKHAGRGWAMDQLFLGCTIDKARQEDASLELAPGPHNRIHYPPNRNHEHVNEYMLEMIILTFILQAFRSSIIMSG